MLKIGIFYGVLGGLLYALAQTSLQTYLHPELKFIFVFLLFQTYLTFNLAQLGLKKDGEKFIPFQLISLTIRFIFSVVFIGYFAYIHTEDMVLFASNFFVLYLCSTNFEIFGLLRNLRRF
ncbi:hypothetical protein [Aquirufa sp. A-Brett2-W8]|jgi:hypothetical protein